MEFESLDCFFETIASEDYLVLRNYEEFASASFLKNHPDVDLLCRDAHALARNANAFPKGDREDGIHYAITIKGQKIPVDLREVGDRYYDPEWADALLHEREKHGTYFVMQQTDYFYTLLYHALFHKKDISEDYLYRLPVMANSASFTFTCFAKFYV